MGVSEEERVARAALCHLDDPDDECLGRIAAALGPAGTLTAIRAGRLPGELAREIERSGATAVAPDRARRSLELRMARWRRRLESAVPRRDIAACERLGGRLVCPGDAEWPTQLDDLGMRRPHALWVSGQEDLRFSCLRSVAVVGARAASPYGSRIAVEMSAELAGRGWCVVSGCAYGIDAAAHRGALAADGITVGVLACGVDVFYPRGNDGLLREVARSGLLVSEVAPGTTPTRGRFLARNRVLAALTRGTVVVEAAARSGAASTAGRARELGRHVMAVPGPVSSHVSVGCHRLLREGGARCVTDAADVLELIGRMGDDLAPERRGPVLPRDKLDEEQRRVLDAFPARRGVGPAEIAATAGIDLDTTLSSLGALAAGGFVERSEEGWRIRRS